MAFLLSGLSSSFSFLGKFLLLVMMTSLFFTASCAFNFNLRKLSDDLVQDVMTKEQVKEVDLNQFVAMLSSHWKHRDEPRPNKQPHQQQTVKLFGAGSPVKNLKAFTWEDCSGKTEEVNVTTLAISPDPLALPGNISVKTAVKIKKTLKAPIQLELVVEKHESFFWLKIPCIDGIGSCTYSDVCQMLKGATCPPDFVKQGIPCRCPFNAGSYNLTGSYYVGQSIPSGEYRITINLSSGGSQILCLKLQASIG